MFLSSAPIRRGTLTQNKMTVQKIYVGQETLNPEELDIKRQLPTATFSMTLY